MHAFFRQHEKFLNRLIGFALIPSYLFGTLFAMGWKQYNLTGILNHPDHRLMAHMIALWILAWMIYRLHIIHPAKKQHLFLFSILCISALFIPYQGDTGIFSNLHILISYAAFIDLNKLLVSVILSNSFTRNIYGIALLFAFLDCLSYGAITGIGETVFASAISIILTIQAEKKDHSHE